MPSSACCKYAASSLSTSLELKSRLTAFPEKPLQRRVSPHFSYNMLVPRANMTFARWVAMLCFIFVQPIIAQSQSGLNHPLSSPSCPQTPNTSYSTLHPRDPNTTLAARAGNFYLRILPLGASITLGTMSSDGNGYRKALRDQLRFDGWNVNMVGSRTGGTMKDSVCHPFSERPVVSN
jgi:hypothetical protein